MIISERLAIFKARYHALSVWFRLLVPFLAGSLTVLAMPPWNVWPALWAGFTAFYVLLDWSRGKNAAFWTGFLFGFGYFIFGLAWTANALVVDGSSYSWVIPFAIGGLPALLAAFTGMAALLSARFTRLRSISGLIGFAGLITLFEWLRGHVMTGFPWNLYGYCWSGVPEVAQTASIGGAYALTLLTVLWASLPGFLLVSPLNRTGKIACAVCVYATLLGSYAWGHARLAANPTIYNDKYVLRIVQPSIPQTMKWDKKKTLDAFQKTVRTAIMGGYHGGADKTVLMIWPETAIEQDVVDNPEARAILKSMFAAYPDSFYLATGVLRWEDDGEKTKYYNSIGVYDKDLNLLETYDKSHLVPFGEYIPLSRWLPANPLVSADGLQQGGGPTIIAIPPRQTDMIRISPMVCYEVIFPGAVVRHGSRPDLLLNVTNDGWYGDTSGPRQHLAIARFRAIEEGVPMARAANTGISAVIDAYGRIVWQTKIFEVTAADWPLPKVAGSLTIYSHYGNSIALILIFFACLTGIAGLFLPFKKMESLS